MDYLDNLSNKEWFTQQGDAITFEAEFERVYLGSPNIVAVLDYERKRTYVIRSELGRPLRCWDLIMKHVRRLNVVMFMEQLLCTHLFSIVTEHLPWNNGNGS
ncbi:putative glucose-6-phosphate 1-epimerase [Tanacetum coccineum]